MPRPRPIYLHRFKNRHGNYVWYVRKPGGRRIRIRGEYGSEDFNAAYIAALDGLKPIKAALPEAKGTMTWLWGQYRTTTAWTALSPATRKQRENIMDGVLKTIGAEPCRSINRGSVTASRDKRSATPAQARNFLDAMRGLFRWALEADHIKIDPTAGVKNPPKTKGPGFPVWTEDDVDRYQAKWPIGTKERVWLDLLLYTGLRRGDAVRLGRQHVRDGIAVLRTEKSQEEVTVTLPILRILQRTLDAGPTADLAFICGGRGQPLTKESFGNLFSAACRKAGLVNKSAHGLRKIAATRAAENGATVSELEALFGWRGGGMASLYTREADRARLAKGAATKLERSMCPPEGRVGTAGEKA
jgi:integrase